MRNRYIYIIVAVTAVMSACTRTEIESRNDSISFKPVAAKATKTIISGTEYPTSESFVVSAFHNGTDAYFEDLTASHGSTYWETSPAQYWPLNGSLTFRAYSPASAGLTIDSDGVSVSDYTVQTAAQQTTDLCYASATVADCSQHPDSVPLTFSHALTQVVFRVKAAEYYNTNAQTVSLAVTSMSIGGVFSIGDLLSSGTWDNLNSLYTYSLSSSSTPLTYDADHLPETTVISSALYIPQELSGVATLNVGYSIVQETNTTTYTLTNPPVSIPLAGTITEWLPGKKYIYTITIGMNNVITFTASAVNWLEENEEIIVEET